MATKNFVEITLHNTTGNPLRHWPTSVGVPFPLGQLHSPGEVALCDDSDNPLPCQTRPLARWPDGSMKWLLLDYQVDAEPQERKSYHLAFCGGTEQPAQDRAISIGEDSNVIAVRTDVLGFTLSRRRFKLFESLSLDGREIIRPDDEGDLIVTDSSGERYYASLDRDFHLEVEERGGLRSVLKMTGSHVSRSGKKFLDFVVRIHVYAHSRVLKISYTFINREEPEEGVGVGNIVALLSLALGPETQRLVKHGTVGYLRFQRYVRVRERLTIKTDQYRSRVDDCTVLGEEPAKYSLDIRRLEPPGNVASWVDVSDGTVGVTTQVWRTLENYPKELVSEANRLEYHLWPAHAGLLELNQGMAKTHDIFLSLHTCDLSDAQREAQLSSLDIPLRPVIPLEWYQRCRVYGLDRVFAYQPQKYPRFHLYLRLLFLKTWARGMLDYGDDADPHYTLHYRRCNFGPPGDVWTNNEYDYIYAAVTQYFRTGDYQLFDDARIASQHLIDVDLIHYSQVPQRTGGVPHHSVRHTTGTVVPSHMFTEGLLGFYCLSGRPEVLEAAIAIGDNILGHLQHRMDLVTWDVRETAWPLVSLCALYEVTNEERFLEGARKLIREGKVLPDAGGESNFLLMGLKRYHILTQEEEAKRLFLGMMDWRLENALEPEGVLEPPLGSRLPIEPLAYAYDLTGEEKYVRVGLRELEHHLQVYDPATLTMTQKYIAVAFRGCIHFLKVADEQGKLKALDYPY